MSTMLTMANAMVHTGSEAGYGGGVGCGGRNNDD